MIVKPCRCDFGKLSREEQRGERPCLGETCFGMPGIHCCWECDTECMAREERRMRRDNLILAVMCAAIAAVVIGITFAAIFA
jgi:hypothetical protein